MASGIFWRRALTMHSFVQFVGKNGTLQLFGVPLVGVNSRNAKKLLLSVVFIALVILITRLLKWITRAFLGERTGQVRFWLKQAISVIEAILLITRRVHLV